MAGTRTAKTRTAKAPTRAALVSPEPAPAVPVLAAESVHVFYGGVAALKGITVEVPTGSITVVIGPNGAGKTTLLRAVTGLVSPTLGRIVLDGAPVGHTSPERMLRRGVAMVPEGRHVFPQLSVEDNLVLGAFRLRRDGAQVGKLIDAAYAWFPVLDERRRQLAGTLSGGEQQMLAIARALMSRPRLLLLDEPSLGLAPKVVKDVFALLGRLRDIGVTILLVEQFAYLALRAADRAYLLEKGELIRSGTGAELLADELVRRSYLGVQGT